MSANTVSAGQGFQYLTISNDTAEGQQLIKLLELQAAEQANGILGFNGTVVPTALPTDPYLLYQWHLDNVGQVVNFGSPLQDIHGTPGLDINVLPVWDRGITGKGITVAVVDSGVQTTHPDLAGNLNLQYAFNAITGSSNANPVGNSADASHGTAVAGLIAATANNAQGGAGVAYGATIVPIKLLSTSVFETPPTEQSFIDAFDGNGAPIDIFNHSWKSYADPLNTRAASGPTPAILDALIASVQGGRGGLGAIHVFAAGNDAGPTFSPGFADIGVLGSMAYNGYASSRYVISVGMVDHDLDEDGSLIFNDDGTITTYGEAGPALLVVAPSASGPFDIGYNSATGSGIFTADLTNGGINVETGDIDQFDDLGYTTRFGGTSAAAPQVSAVIALMLEADKKANGGVSTLSYRDVQEILVRSAKQVSPDDESWVVNSVPFYHDPIPHTPGGMDYFTGGNYPDDEDEWNDEIIWQIIPGEITTPAVPASTDDITSANMATFSIEAVAGGPLDGAGANGLAIEFDTAAGPTGATIDFDLESETLTIIVMGTPTWGEIRDDFNAILGDVLQFSLTSGHENIVFSPADANLNGELAGGVNAEGEESMVVRDPLYVGYNPVLFPLSLQFPESLPTNGAGYTVSQGWISDFANQYGFGHGMIDADLAVKMASQWSLKDQTLAPEKTVVVLLPADFKVQAAEISEGTDAPGDETFVPGGVTGPGSILDSFIDYYQEFFKEPDIAEGEEGDPETGEEGTPDTIDHETLPFRGDDPPSFGGRGSYISVPGPSNMSLDWVELKVDIPYDDANNLDFLRLTLVSPDGTHSELMHYQYTGDFSANNRQFYRQTAVYPDSGNPVIRIEDPPGTLDADDDGIFTWTFATNRHWGERSEGEWKIYFENYSPEGFVLGNMQLLFHGQDVGTLGQNPDRYLGFVDDSGGYLGHGSNVTVYVKDAVGNRVAQFITGADGNYYFDVAGSGYTLGIDVPAGYQMAGGGPSEVPLADGHRFQLEPLVLPATEVTFTGQVFADLNGNGVQNATDAGVKDFVVYADLNHNGQFDTAEPNTLTDEQGRYTFTHDVSEPVIITIGVKSPPGWQVTNPAAGSQGVLASPNTTSPITANFGVKPPSTPTGQGEATIYGLAFNDVNGNGVFDSSFETGIAGLVVYIDNGDEVFNEAEDIFTTTNAAGAYVFNDVAPGEVDIRVAVNSEEIEFELTVPASGSSQFVVAAGEVKQGVLFGIKDLRTHDFGDLQGAGFLTGAANGPRHRVIQGFSLGSRVDAEISARLDDVEDGEGDDKHGALDPDLMPLNDEDGVIIVGGFLRPGENVLRVTLNGEGGFLTGWIDFNSNGTFDTGEQVFPDLDLNSGVHNLTVTAPQDLQIGTTVAARFRWGSEGNDWFGADNHIGEVEDYLFATKAAALPGDYNFDDTVDHDDYLVWKSSFGSTINLQADGNKNGRVDAADYAVWRDHMGMSIGSGSGGAAALVATGSSTPLEAANSPSPIVTVSVDEPLEAPSWIALGEGPATTGDSGSSLADADSVAVPNFGGGSTSGGAAIELISLQFSTSVGHAVEAVEASNSTAGAAARADLAMLLLATGNVRSDHAQDDDELSADLQWLNADDDQDAELESALAAAFEEEIDWRGVA